MELEIDWSHREEYIACKHQTTPTIANEALTDPNRVVISPDYASRSGASDRTIGWSTTAGVVLTVITVEEDDGTLFGVNCWKANEKDQRLYREGTE
ncbi:transposase [Gordonia sp. PKS22-38]|uniref:Transposase n=1 Tax=Gordonia prachuapensis TaxID=3115651 RepID=A0ABU7MYW4_9ACTN|nr:transposase [Gordonia sp. PKS22-38]